MIAATAPAILESQPTAAAPTGSATTAGTPGFDAILMLQGLAGTAETLDSATFESDDTADALATDGDDETDDDIEASLAFLANLIAATTPPQSRDFEAGAGGQGADEADPGLPLPLEADAGFALAVSGADAADTTSGGALALNADLLDKRQAGGDASQNLARAAELLAQAPRAATETARPVVTLHARDPRWADDFSARVSLMVRAGESTASLQLTPVDLGPVEISVSVKDSQATIHFGASQAETRALIEASLPRLRELLASQGFNLMDASVSSGFSRSKQPASSGSARGNGESEAPVAEVRAVRQLGLLDLYA